MKKLNYLFLALVLGLGTFACNDDDNDDPQPTVPEQSQPGEPEQSQPGEPEPSQPELPVVTHLSSIKNYDVYNEGFYEMVTLTRNADGKVTDIKCANYTPEGTIQGEENVLAVVYNEEEVVISNDYEKVTYTLDAAGKVASSEYAVIEEGEEYVGWTTTYTYTEAGKLAAILVDMEGETMPLFEASYDENNIMVSVTMEEEEIDVTLGANLNRADVDMNLLLLASGFIEDVNYAIWCGLLKTETNNIESMYEGYITYNYTFDEAANISSVTVDEDGETMMNIEFAY